MSSPQPQPAATRASVEAYLLGRVDYQACVGLQQRLVYELSGRDDGQIAVLLCEHAPLVTIGRNGSWADLVVDPSHLARCGAPVVWSNRGGGSVVHGPGQLAVYVVAPLVQHKITVGAYLHRFREALSLAIREQGVAVHYAGDGHDVYGRTGRLADVGVSVRSWTTYHGAFINLNTSPEAHRWLRDPAGSLACEKRTPMRAPKLREAVVRRVAEAFGVSRVHWYTGHPLLKSQRLASYEAAARVG